MATAAAAAVARARRDIQHHFFCSDAVRRDRVVEFEPRTGLQARQFERMEAVGIIREAGPGRYWLDVVAYDVDLSGRYRRVKFALFVAILVILVGFVIGLVKI